MVIATIPNCFKRKCRHLIIASDEELFQSKVACRAFPTGIPEEIAYGDNLHTAPYPGDHGIQYEGSQDEKGGEVA
jgi:hypothetical protein